MATKKSSKKGSRKPNSAFMKPLKPDEALAKIVGDEAQPRTQITSRLWAYIKKKGLQNKSDRRKIDADDLLKAVFNGKKQVSMFEMTKLVAKHVK
jgi:chromatin remodeling complex protein RSC6